MKHTTEEAPCCPINRLIEKVCKKWTMLILRTLTERKRLRFGELLEALPDINSRILSERLGELEAEGLISRTVEQAKPITVTYEVTEKGLDLRRVFGCFSQWAKKWQNAELNEWQKCQEHAEAMDATHR